MPETNGIDTNFEKPSWNSSQLTQRAWVDDLLLWLPTCNAAYASLIEHGYTLTPQGRVVVYSYQHAQAVFLSLHTPYTLDAPSPIAPVINFATAPSAAASAGPATRSTPASAAPTTAAPTTQPVSTALRSATPVRNLTADERDHFVILPEQLASVDRQLIESILGTIASPATRPSNAPSPSSGLAIESMMDSLLLKGLSGASLTEFNELHHAFTRLNRSLLPAHAQLAALIAEELCAVVRRISESINTIIFDVKLVMKGATGNLARSLATIRKILSDFEAREVRRSLELDKPAGRAYIAKQMAQTRDRNKRRDPLRRARNKKTGTTTGTLNSSYVRCRHCGGTHWHRDCPKRRKARSDSDAKGRRASGSAALAGADAAGAAADEKLDAAIGDVLLTGDSRPRSIEMGRAFCVQSAAKNATNALQLTPEELAA
eukprot:1721334-Pleurochrysis_carterae.AAC.1